MRCIIINYPYLMQLLYVWRSSALLDLKYVYDDTNENLSYSAISKSVVFTSDWLLRVITVILNESDLLIVSSSSLYQKVSKNEEKRISFDHGFVKLGTNHCIGYSQGWSLPHCCVQCTDLWDANWKLEFVYMGFSMWTMCRPLATRRNSITFVSNGEENTEIIIDTISRATDNSILLKTSC